MIWRHIDTAPKDGTLVLLTGGQGDGMWDDEPEYVVAHHNGVPSEPWVVSEKYHGTTCGYSWPTHWHPLTDV